MKIKKDTFNSELLIVRPTETIQILAQGCGKKLGTRKYSLKINKNFFCNPVNTKTQAFRFEKRKTNIVVVLVCITIF